MIDLTKKLYLDGGMGSLLMEYTNVTAGYPLERFNITHPDIVKKIHMEYLESGSDIIFTNTFGANRYKFDKNELSDIITAGIDIAKQSTLSTDKFIALDIGPLGKMIGDGDIGEQAAYDAFAEIVNIAKDRTDLIVIETMTNLVEARIATLAVLENSNLPVMVAMSFEKNMRSVFGTSIASFCTTIGGLGVDAIGINCTLDAGGMVTLAKELSQYTAKPLFIKPNAGMPILDNGKTVYKSLPQDFAEDAVQAFGHGINIIGGCCGTTPSHIAKLKVLGDKTDVRKRYEPKKSSVCSAYKYITVDKPLIVGERINPTGKKLFQQALMTQDWGYILKQALEQQEQGADILDVNVGMNGIDEPFVMRELVKRLQQVSDLPLVIDSANVAVIDSGLRAYHGKAIINSVNGTNDSLDTILPIAKKYGSAVIGLLIDENGISQNVSGRVDVAKKIIERCQQYGIALHDIYIDTLTMAQASLQGSAKITLDTLKEIKKLGCKTVLGISNISFGMPNRTDINAKFMEMALESGLDLCIINPLLKGIQGSNYAENFLLDRPNATADYIAYAEKNIPQVVTNDAGKTLFDAVLRGHKELALELAQQLKLSLTPAEIINNHIIPALDKLGESYNDGKVFLPQLIAGADAAKLALSEFNKEDSKIPKSDKRFIIATVKGDVHDIGKNIVKTVIANYGYHVIDLGKDVDYQTVIDAVAVHYPCVLGLSALMTTTAENMATTIKLVKEKFDIPVLAGGAVLTPDYVASIGGIYCKDAGDAVKLLKDAFSHLSNILC